MCYGDDMRRLLLTVLLAACDRTTPCPEGQVPSGSGCVDYMPADPEPAGDAWQPVAGLRWQIQLSGAVDTTFDVEAYDVDLFDTPAATWDALHGRKRLCYVSFGSWEDWRDDADQFPAEALGHKLDGWPGERWLDYRLPEVLDLLAARLDVAVARGCDGVDPDNVDGYANNNGLGLRATDQLVFNRWFADEAHKRGLGVGLKNDLGQIDALVGWFDWQVNEQCFQYDECARLDPFLDADKPVLNIEYAGSWSRAQDRADEVCPSQGGKSTLVKLMELGPERIACP